MYWAASAAACTKACVNDGPSTAPVSETAADTDPRRVFVGTRSRRVCTTCAISSRICASMAGPVSIMTGTFDWCTAALTHHLKLAVFVVQVAIDVGLGAVDALDCKRT